MPIVKLSKSERRRLSVFFTCLIFALIAWLFTTLSNQYAFTVKAIVNFNNFPQKKAFHPLQSDTVDVTVEGTGWQMLFSKARFITWNVVADLKTLESKNYIILSTQLRKINSGLDKNQQIVSFSPDTLYFDFSSRSVKRVPVEVQYNLKFQKQYAINGEVEIKPNFITLVGPSENISKIKSWKTDSLVATDVNESLNRRLSLQSVKEGNMTIYPKIVEVSIPVDEFTEKTIEVPVKLINNKQFYNVKLFPAKVKITFTTSLSSYASINENFFEAVADLNQWREHGYRYFPVQLVRVPPFCKVVKVEPENVDFIIRK
ncbi:MAG: YbbR-like domain-containing protein [Sphingobacteriaceae bacterium]